MAAFDPATRRRWVGLLVVLCVGATACDTSTAGSSPSPSPSPSSSQPAPAPASASAPVVSTHVVAAPTDSATPILEGLGVSIVDAISPSDAGADLTLTTAQVALMDAEAAGHGGITGSVLDAAGGGAPSGIPMSAVLAGWLRGVQTPAAEYGRAVMAGQDLTRPDGAVFPTVVLTMFAADAAQQISADAVAPSGLLRSRTDGALAPARLQRAGGICSDITKSIFATIDKLFAKIHIPQGRVGDTGSSFLNGLLQGLTDVVVGTLNFVIDAARTLIVNGIKYLLDQVLSVVAEVAAAAALIGNFVSAVRPWTLELKPEAGDTVKGIDPDKVYDSATAKARLIGPTDDWPDWFVDCSKIAGVTLPSLLPVDAVVVWKVASISPDLMKESEDQFPKETKLHKDASGAVVAKLGLVTGTETAAQAATGQPQQGSVTVSATARRDQIEDIRTTLVDAVHNLAARVLVAVPAFIRDYLLTLVDEAAGSSSNQLASLLDASTAVAITVTYHGAPEPLSPAPITAGANPSQYCTLFIDFANWSLANLSAVMAEAAEATYTVRDAFFTEYLQRMAAMQQVEPAELHDALAVFADYAMLYLAHNTAAVVAKASAMGPAGATINDYGKRVCGYDPQVTTNG